MCLFVLACVVNWLPLKVSIVFIFWLFCILVIAKDFFIIYLACVARVVGSLFASHWKIYIDFKTSTINFYFVKKKMTSLKIKPVD